MLQFIHNWSQRFGEISRGYKVYKKIKLKYGKDLCICVSQHRALGDAYLAGLYLNRFHKKDFVVTALGEGAEKVYRYLSIKNVEVLNERDTNSLIAFCHFVEIPQEEVRVLHHQALLWNTGILWNMQGVKDINFAQLMETIVFPEMTKEDREFPRIEITSSKKEEWEKQGIKYKESIILFPYANTLQAPPIQFWESLVSKLKNDYDSIFTYVYGNEEIISGTKAIREEIENVAPLVEYAGNVIGARNGMTDIFARADAKKIILYPQKGTESWISGSAKNYWSIRNFEFCDEVTELEWNDFILEQLIDWITERSVISGMKNEPNTVVEMLDRKLRILRFAQMEWDLLWPSLKYEENDYIILFPESDKEINTYGMKYLDTYLQRRSGSDAIIVTSDSFVKRNIQKYSKNIKKVIFLEKEKMDRLVSLYELYIFAPNLVIVSLDAPYGRNATGQIGIKNTTVEQLIAIGVYSILPFRALGDEKIV